MSLEKRLARGTEGLTVPPDASADKEARPPRTGPGQMLAFRGEILAKDAQLQQLRSELAAAQSNAAAHQIEPQRIRASRLANRLPQSFDTAEFRRFKDEIAAAGGNVQPIKLRPVRDDPAFDWEIVFGHRRHRACLDLAIPVLAVIEDLDDTALFVEMDRENRGRADLSPYEAGVHFRRALDEKLWPSIRQMADSLSISHTSIQLALVLADLPLAVVEAFGTPLDLQFRWGKPLTEALQRDPEGILARAEAARKLRPTLSGQRVFALLTETAPDVTRNIKVGRKILARVQHKSYQMSVVFAKNAVSSDRMDELEQVVRRFLFPEP